MSDYEGLAYLHRDGAPEAFISAQPGTDSSPVGVSRLDRLVACEPSRAVVIKIDTEGQEAATLRGCAGWVARGVEPILFMECLPSMHEQTRHSLLYALRESFGGAYRLWMIDQAAGRVSEFTRGEELGARVCNILALPPRHLSRLQGLHPE